MGSHVHRASIGIAGCHRPLGGQCLDLSDRPSGTQDSLANLTQLPVGCHAQPPSRPVQGVEISGGGASGFDDHQVVVPADINDCDPRIRRGCSALECKRCSEQLRVVRHEPVEVCRGESQMVDSEKIGHSWPTVVQPLDATRVVFESWSQRLTYQGELDGGFVVDGELLVARRDTSGLFEESDPALDFVSGLVSLAVEPGWAAAGRTSASAVSGLVTFLRDGVQDLPTAQVLADLSGGVGAVGQDVGGAGAWMSSSYPRNSDAVHDLGEQWRAGPRFELSGQRPDSAWAFFPAPLMGDMFRQGAELSAVVLSSR